MVHCKQNNVDIQSFLALLLLVTSQTRSASVESREVEALSNLRRRRPPRSKSWEDKVGAKPQPSRSKTKISLHPCTSREQGLGPARFFLGLTTGTVLAHPPAWIAEMCSRSHRTHGR